MSLKDILPAKKEEPKEYYWALTIEPGWVQAGVWRVFEDKTQVVATSPATPWELEEELVSAVDTALSASIKNFPDDTPEPSKAVFGVVASWVSKGQIKEEHLGKIRKICSELSLKPLGFVLLPEAIAYLVKSEEGSPANAVVLGVSKEHLEVSIFRLGKLVRTSQVARSLSVIDDAVEGLTRFTQDESFPSRFILYDGKAEELEEVKQALLKANWDDFGKLKFLHTPKIEAVSSERKVHAVALAGASELADVTTLQAVKEEKEEVEEQEGEEVEILEDAALSKEAISPQELGFAVGQDIAAVKRETEEVVPPPSTYGQKQDVVAKTRDQEPAMPQKETKRLKLFGKSNIFKIIKNKLSMLSIGFIKPKPGVALSKKTFIFGSAFFVAILLGGLAFWWFYPKAVVTVYVSPRKLDEKVGVTIDTDAGSPDFSNRVLPGNILKATVSGDRTKSTTGTKTVGEKARGEVALYRVGPGLTLALGTKLSGPNTLEFTLDESVAVASGSASTPGITKALVTAVDIGAQYNLAGGTAFSVGNYSTADIEAKNESSFSGGSSREISAVSQEDQLSLEKELTEELMNQAKQDLLRKLASDKFFIEETLIASPSARTFSNKIGDEASSLKLSLSLATRAITVNEGELNNFAQEVLKDKIPEGFVLRSEQIDVDFDFEGEVNGKFELETAILANLLPEIDPVEVARKIAGKYPSLVKDYLNREIPGLARAEISFRKPRLPGKLGNLPRIAKNIEVIIAAER